MLLPALILKAIPIAIGFVVLYFVIKHAIINALKEINK